MRPAPLIDVLGGSWSLGVPVVAAAWDDGLACFALGDGSVAQTRAEWAGGPVLVPRLAGGLELRPGEPPPPLARQAVHREGCLALRPATGRGFLSGGANAVLVRVDTDLAAEILLVSEVGQAEHFAIAPDGRHHATALGNRVEIAGVATAVFDLPAPAVALLFDNAGRRLAVADGQGVTLWSVDGPPARLQTSGVPCGLAWAPDDGRLACGVESGAVHLWSFGAGDDETLLGGGGPPRSLTFAPDGCRLAVSGATQILCWSLEPRSDMPMTCGITARVPISMVAWHPARDLIAAGTGNGAVMLSAPFGHDALHLRGEGGGAVTVLAWSADGSRLAIGTSGGDLGVLPLPDALFRPRSQETLQ
jgi:Anaphase-promoting complex subunit 4 WD40 domain